MSEIQQVSKIKAMALYLQQPSRMKSVSELLPRHLNLDKFLKGALFAIQKSAALQECTPASVYECIAMSAQLGLDPSGALGQAYLIPFRDNKTNTRICTLIPGYRGLISLARNTGHIETIYAVPYFAGETFDYQEGDDPRITHKPDGTLAQSERTMLGAYAVATLKGGGKQRVHMYKKEIDAIRARSKAKDSGPWVTDYLEMAKKTVIRRLIKMLPMSSEQSENLAMAIRQDDAVDITGQNHPIDIDYTDISTVEGDPAPGKTEALAEKVTQSAFDKARDAVDNIHSEIEVIPAQNMVMALPDGEDKNVLLNEIVKKKRAFAAKVGK